MAYSAEQWERAKALYVLGYSLRDIEKDCGISNGQINKKAKAQDWKKEADKTSIIPNIREHEEKKEALEQEKEAINHKIASLSDFEITVLKEKIEDEELRFAKSLIFNTQYLAVIRNNEILSKGKKQVLLKTAQYDRDGGRMETYEPYEIDINSSDIKDIIESTDKASITLKVSDRHAKGGDVNVQTNTQVNNTPLEIKFVD